MQRGLLSRDEVFLIQNKLLASRVIDSSGPPSALSEPAPAEVMLGKASQPDDVVDHQGSLDEDDVSFSSFGW